MKKVKRQCEFGSVGNNVRCTKVATRKWGDAWFCDEHGARPYEQKVELKNNQVGKMKSISKIHQSAIKLQNKFYVYEELKIENNDLSRFLMEQINLATGKELLELEEIGITKKFVSYYTINGKGD